MDALVDRLTRRTEEITRMDANIMMSLETKEFIQKETDASKDAALSFQDTMSYWQFKIARLLLSNQDTAVNQFSY